MSILSIYYIPKPAYGSGPLQGVAEHMMRHFILVSLSSSLFVFGEFHDNFKHHKPKHLGTTNLWQYISKYVNKMFVVVTEIQCVIRSLWICLFPPQSYFSVWWLKSG